MFKNKYKNFKLKTIFEFNLYHINIINLIKNIE